MPSSSGHLGHRGPELFRRHPADRGEHGHHRVVDPDVDGAKLARELVRSGKNSVRVADIERRDGCLLGPSCAQFVRQRLKRDGVARDTPRPAPARANRVATARPTPAAAPVTTTTLLVKDAFLGMVISFQLAAQ